MFSREMGHKSLTDLGLGVLGINLIRAKGLKVSKLFAQERVIESLT